MKQKTLEIQTHALYYRMNNAGAIHPLAETK